MSMERPETRLVLSTFADEKTAEAAVRSLLEEHLIACGTMIPPARSLYLWKRKIEESSEVMVLFKTARDTASRCMDRLKEIHPYEVPEIILLHPESVSSPYEAWIRESLRKPE